MTNCNITQCDDFFRDKKCMCYAVKNTRSPRENQICGYYENGILYECNAGCCPGGCPTRKCPGSGVLPKNPDNYIPEDAAIISDPQAVRAMFKFDNLFTSIYVILFVMLSLLINIEFGMGIAVVLSVVLYANRNSLKNAIHGIPLSVPQLWPLSNLSSLSSLLLPKT